MMKFWKRYWFLLTTWFIVIICFSSRLSELSKPNRYLFDEDMHAFTARLISQGDIRAYEWWHKPLIDEQNQYTYRAPAVEWLHPPLAKLIQALSIKLLGDVPVAWRLPSSMAGALIIFATIQLTHLLTNNRALSLLSGVLAGFEHLLLVQSRIASPDIFVTLFILLTTWSYWLLLHKPNGLRLLLTGILFGMAVATKWSALFLFPGLVVFSFTYFKHTLQLPNIWQILHRTFLLNFAILSVGLGIYVLSYSQAFLLGKNADDIFNLHVEIINYQTTATFEHPYQSRPQEWLLGQKPIFYYYNQINNEKIETIVAQPTLWILLLGQLSIAWMLGRLLRTAIDKNLQTQTESSQNLFIICSFLALFIPWLFITRPLFIYQLTPIMPLLIIVIVKRH